MIQPTVTTWILVIFGILFIFLPLFCAQFLMATRPHNRKTKDLIIGKGEDWRDKSHCRNSFGHAWGDLIIFLPSMAAGSIGVVLGHTWGYVLWAVSGAISVYINVVLWFSEREYVYPAHGPLVYYTYYWGFFVYWGIAVVVYAVHRLVAGI